jgi:23S rRNA (uracil-5-)-methyltransferase RumA
VLYGRDYLIEEILDLKFKISAFSFFQTNSYGAEKLYETVREFAGDVSDKIVFDLYSGTGTIGIIMAPMAKKVIGIELVEEAVMSARENAELNGLKNCTFIAGDVSKKLKEIKEMPDVVIVDPPRSGINPKALEDIIKFNPQKVVYVSCNPESLARDLKIFSEGGYKVDKVKCVDMFPHTYHVECVTLMSRVEK